MKFSTRLALAAVFCLVSVETGAAAAYAQRATAPIGFNLFCIKNPSQCRPGGKASISKSPRMLWLLRQVNLSVNKAMQAKADSHGDVWTLGAAVGDCEDYVLNKRAALIRDGLPPSALRIAYVKTRSGAEHAVLVAMVGTTRLVLDNLTDHIGPLARSGLTLLRISGTTPTNWI